MAVLVAVHSLRYFIVPQLLLEDGWGHHLFNHPIATYIHFTCGPIALVSGTVQFFWLRPGKSKAFHKIVGRIYVSTCCLGALSALPLALETKSGPVASSGLFLLAVAWLSTTIHATWLVMVGEITAHQRWMTRSYALTYSGVILRLMVFVSNELIGLDYDTVYPPITWLCWLLPLLAVELYRGPIRSIQILKPSMRLK